MNGAWYGITYWDLARLAFLAVAIVLFVWLFRRASRKWKPARQPLREALFISIWILALITLPLPGPNTFPPGLYTILTCWHLDAPLCLVLGLVWFIPKWIAAWALAHPQSKDYPEGIKQARILGTILLAAVLLDEGVLRIPPLSLVLVIFWVAILGGSGLVGNRLRRLRRAMRWTRVFATAAVIAVQMYDGVAPIAHPPDYLQKLYTLTYAVKWEFFALIATAAVSLDYLRAHKKRIKQIKRIDADRYNLTTNYIIAFGFVLVADLLAFLPILFTDSVALLRTASYARLALLIVLSWCFWRADHHICMGINVQRPRNVADRELYELKHISHSLVRLVDIPTFISLCFLAGFLVIHWLEHRVGQPLSPFLQSPGKSPEPVRLWTSADYFVSGITAFQYLTMTVVSVILAFNQKPAILTQAAKEVIAGESLISS